MRQLSRSVARSTGRLSASSDSGAIPTKAASIRSCTSSWSFHAGLAGRRETKSDGGKELMDGLRLLFEGGRDRGIRLIGTFGNAAHTPGGFAHYAIFEVDSVDMVGKMDSDFMSADWSHMLQDFALHLGSERKMIAQHFSYILICSTNAPHTARGDGGRPPGDLKKLSLLPPGSGQRLRTARLTRAELDGIAESYQEGEITMPSTITHRAKFTRSGKGAGS